MACPAAMTGQTETLQAVEVQVVPVVLSFCLLCQDFTDVFLTLCDLQHDSAARLFDHLELGIPRT